MWHFQAAGQPFAAAPPELGTHRPLHPKAGLGGRRWEPKFKAKSGSEKEKNNSEDLGIEERCRFTFLTYGLCVSKISRHMLAKHIKI